MNLKYLLTLIACISSITIILLFVKFTTNNEGKIRLLAKEHLYKSSILTVIICNNGDYSESASKMLNGVFKYNKVLCVLIYQYFTAECEDKFIKYNCLRHIAKNKYLSEVQLGNRVNKLYTDFIHSNPEYINNGLSRILEIPDIQADIDVYLYLDNDITVCGSFPRLFTEKIKLTVEHDVNGSALNTGVMILNVDFIKKTHDRFINYLRNINFMARTFDQDVILDFYKTDLETNLPLSLNWKSYWPIRREVSIIHWHGIKENLMRNFMDCCTSGKGTIECGHYCLGLKIFCDCKTGSENLKIIKNC